MSSSYGSYDELEQTLLQTAQNCEKMERLSDSDDDDEPVQAPKQTLPMVDTVREKIEPEPRNLKRCSDEPEASSKQTKLTSDLVAHHYNTIERGLEERARSKIFHLRNFNNWVKSMLINEYLTKLRDSKSFAKLKVLDLCCGKGGDLQKWRKGNISHLICCDIADVSVKECRSRYDFMAKRLSRNERLFTAEFITADVTRANLRKCYQDKTVELDLVSCQFSFHYSFESLPQLECMLQNVSECLKPGGYFIGTIPNAYELVARAHKAGSTTYGNDIYRISFAFDANNAPLFGAKYDFFLEDAVNCPEFLVYFPLLVKLGRKYGLKLIKKESFADVFANMNEHGRALLKKMTCLETFTKDGAMNFDADEYAHVRRFLKENHGEIGTLSKAEWDATTLYLAFAFEKQKRTGWSREGKPEYAD